jgi:hypothetical protein
MRTLGHEPNSFREPIGFVDTLAFLTLASVVGVALITVVTAIVSLLG